MQLLAITVSKYFFSVLLVDIAVRDADLQNVFRSVTEHGRSILVTAFFGAIVIYFFSIFALVTLQNGDVTTAGPEPFALRCSCRAHALATREPSRPMTPVLWVSGPLAPPLVVRHSATLEPRALTRREEPAWRWPTSAGTRVAPARGHAVLQPER